MEKFKVSFFPKSNYSRYSDLKAEAPSAKYLTNTFQPFTIPSTAKPQSPMKSLSFTLGRAQAKYSRNNLAFAQSQKQYSANIVPQHAKLDIQQQDNTTDTGSFESYILRRYQQDEHLIKEFSKRNNAKRKSQPNHHHPQHHHHQLHSLSKTKDSNPYAYNQMLEQKMKKAKPAFHYDISDMINLDQSQTMKHGQEEKEEEEKLDNSEPDAEQINPMEIQNSKENTSLRESSYVLREQNTWRYREQIRKLCQDFHKDVKQFQPLLPNSEQQEIIDQINKAVSQTQQFHQTDYQDSSLPLFIDQIDLPKNESSHLRVIKKKLDDSMIFQFKGFGINTKVFIKDKFRNSTAIAAATSTGNNFFTQLESQEGVHKKKFASATHQGFFQKAEETTEETHQNHIDYKKITPFHVSFRIDQTTQKNDLESSEFHRNTIIDPNYDDQLKSTQFDAFFQQSNSLKCKDLSNFCRLSRSLIRSKIQSSQQGKRNNFSHSQSLDPTRTQQELFQIQVNNLFNDNNITRSSLAFDKNFTKQLIGEQIGLQK